MRSPARTVAHLALTGLAIAAFSACANPPARAAAVLPYQDPAVPVAERVTDLLARMKDPEVARVVQGEQRLFEIRRAAREGQMAQLRERVAQLKEQVQGLADQVGAKKREIELIGQELKGVRELWSKNLIPITRVTALERDAARLEGERGSLVSTIAQTKGKMTETELQILQIDQDLRTEVGKDLAEIRGKVSELVEKRVAAADQLNRIDIRSPQDGKVHQLVWSRDANGKMRVYVDGQQMIIATDTQITGNLDGWLNVNQGGTYWIREIKVEGI